MSDPYDIDDGPSKTPPPVVPRGGADVPPPAPVGKRDEPLPVPATNYAATAATLLKLSAAVALLGVLAQLVQAFTGGGILATVLGCAMLLGFLVAIAAIVVYMLWQHGAYKLVRQLGEQTTYTPGWSVGWWFVPVANLIFSKTILQDLWIASGATASASPAGGAEAQAGGRPRTVWLCLVGYAVVAVIGIIFAFLSPVVAALILAVAYLLMAGFWYLLGLYTDDVERAIDERLPKPKKPVAAAPAA